MGNDVLGIQPIRTKFLQPNYLFALRFQEGYLFGRALDRELVTWDPYDQLGMLQPGGYTQIYPASFYGSANAISPNNANQTDVVLAVSQSLVNLKDVLYIPTGKSQLLHGAIGIKPNYVYCYARNPLGETYYGRWPAVQPPNPNNGDQFARFSGYDSPYEDPTDAVELVIPPGIDTSYQFFLGSKYVQVQPVLNLRFALYNVEIFDPNGQSFEKSLIAAISRRSAPAAYMTAGPASLPISYEGTNQTNNFPKNISPITLRVAQGLS